MRRRADARARPTLPRAYVRPEPAWRVGHYDGPTDPAGRREEARFLATGIVPPIYRHNPGACHSLLLRAQALDIPESIALENVHWNTAVGKGSISAQLMAGLLRRHHYEFKVTEQSDQRAAMTFYRITDGRRRKLGDVEWKITEAIGAGLMWRDLWRHYPTDMLWARCLMRGSRRYASEVGTGLAYTAEELADMSDPADGSELSAAVQDILEKATTAGVTADQIRNDLVKLAKAKKLLEVDTGDGHSLGYVLGMLYGEALARDADRVAASAPVAAPEPPPAPAGTGRLDCGCPAERVLTSGLHVPETHRGAPAVSR
jgi:hypothetical protein